MPIPWVTVWPAHATHRRADHTYLACSYEFVYLYSADVCAYESILFPLIQENMGSDE